MSSGQRKMYLSCWARGTLYEHAVEEGGTVTLCGLEAVDLDEDPDWMPESVWAVPQCSECSGRWYEETTRKRGRARG